MSACCRSPPHHVSTPDGVLTFDRLSSLFLSDTDPEEEQPVHHEVKEIGLRVSRTMYWAAPRSATAGGRVPWVEGEGGKRYQVSAHNCVHFKTFDI
jgi:electron-transferring-flavoprotein dehydrogenase